MDTEHGNTVEQSRRPLSSKKGEVGMGILIKVVEVILTSFIIGGVLLWGNYQVMGTKMEYITATVTDMKSKLDTTCTTLVTHIAQHEERDKIIDRLVRESKSPHERIIR